MPTIVAPIVLLWALSSAWCFAEKPVLHFASVENSILHQISQKILIEAYQSIGVEVEFKAYPGSRALSLSNRGYSDGEVHRIDGISKKYPNLLQVPISLQQVHWHAFSKKRLPSVTRWQDLQRYQLAVITGIVYTKNKTRHMQVTTAPDFTTMFRMLDKGRVDIALTSLLNGQIHLKDLDFPGIKAHEKSLSDVKLYHYLHTKNRHLQPQVKAALQQMKATGRLQEIRDQYVQSL